MVQADVLKAQIAAEERQTAATKDSIANQIANLEAKQVTLTDRLEELKREKEELAARVDEDLLDRFNRLFASKGDAAVVALEHDVRCT
jgi:predicted  nucleic acid-binding Zn-ribbon protein